MKRDQSGLYLHIPFCVSKCPYCDFNTFDVERGAVRDFLTALRRELKLVKEVYAPDPFDTLFIGGGTPTVLSGTQLSEVVGWVHESVGISPGAEVTVEANPGSVTRKGLRAMVEAGVNRVSLGVQSFSDELLRRLGRNHTVREIYSSYELMREAGIENVSFDLMYALPGQTRSDWEKSLAESFRLAPEHLSCYSLIIEEGTPFAVLHKRGELELPPEDEDAWMYEYTIQACAEHGYEQYEISNFARPGYASRHNLLYWRNAEWIGVGPGAHSAWHKERLWNVRPLDQYSRFLENGQLPVEGREPLSLDQQMDETLMLGLRLVEGVELQEFASRFGHDLMEVYGPTVEQLLEWELVRLVGGSLQLTSRGRMMGNRVLAEFLR